MVSMRGNTTASARGVGSSSFANPLASKVFGGKRGLSTGVTPSPSESLTGVAAPLSEDIQSSSSPSEGLAIENPAFCLDPPLALEFAEVRRNGGPLTESFCSLILLLLRAIWVPLRLWAFTYR